jgi:hypothetical protein
LRLRFKQNADATCLVIKKMSVTVHGSHEILRLKRKKKEAARSCFLRGKTLNHAQLFIEQ